MASHLTYSESRANALFKAAREIRKIAAAVLNDCNGDVECRSIETFVWAKNAARTNAEVANRLEQEAYETAYPVNPHTDAAQYKSRSAYIAAINHFEDRVVAQVGREGLERFKAEFMARENRLKALQVR